jgi:Tfp pilus assembly protein PilF
MQKARLIFLAILFCLSSNGIVFAQQIMLQEGIRNYQQGHYEQSIELLEKVIKSDSLQLNAYVILSASYLKKEVPEVSQLRAEQGLHHFPNAG